MKGNKLFLYSLTSLAVIASSAVSAEELATAPSLEGGWSAMLGGFLFVPSVEDQAYDVNYDIADGFLNSTTVNDNADYDTGWQAAIGYVFDDTANGIELSYRSFDSGTDSGPSGPINVGPSDGLFNSADGVTSNQDNRYQNWDLMVSQFLDIGTHVQMRFLGGLSYLSELDQTTKNDLKFEFLDDLVTQGDIYDDRSSSFSGLGPRVGIDARYDFGDDLEGFGIVGGASFAYFLGELNTNNDLTITGCFEDGRAPKADCNFADDAFKVGANADNQNDNHSVTNLRANLGIDYVYYFEDQDLPTLGLELGYEVDTYLDGVGSVGVLGGEIDVTDVTYSGPYLNIKGVF